MQTQKIQKKKNYVGYFIWVSPSALSPVTGPFLCFM